MESMIPTLLGWAVLLPLISFFLILVAGPKMGKGGSFAAMLATFCIGAACVLSLISLKLWLNVHPIVAHHGGHGAAHGDAHGDGRHGDHGETEHGSHDNHSNASEDHGEESHDEHGEKSHDEHGEDGHAVVPSEGASEILLVMADDKHADAHATDHAEGDSHADDGHAAEVPNITGNWYTLAEFGSLKLTIGYFVDSLTIAMFCMVTLIATCIHVYAMGYMHDELHDFTDHEVHMSDGSHLTRPGRYHRFFQALSLFCFSMLGLVVSGNIAMTFVFWELVGICSYFLIGFYVERHSASTAANKAFIVNRVGDFGMIIGLMAIWGSLGTFAFGDIAGDGPGIFSQVRPASTNHAMIVPDGMVKIGARQAIADNGGQIGNLDDYRDSEKSGKKGGYGYWLLFVAGVGIFCGCVGKSAQFPLHVWLPDAMEGPTPVSALVHSATMVAAGVYLVARFYPVFNPDALLVIAIVGVITLFMAATIAITATDIKRVLAYSTVSQLGYMMTALGVGGWLAGVLHLFTHAFFKSLLFMCSGSVIHAVHTNEMTEMGGLRKKMPWTAYTMLIGCLAIAGAGIPFVIGFSGYYSKDAILEQALLFKNVNPGFGSLFFFATAGGAAITAFYMFRLWYMTFAGTPRDQHRYDHAHESPPSMYVPLVLLSIFAVSVAWRPSESVLGMPEPLFGLILTAIIIGVILFWKGLSYEWLALPVGFLAAILIAWWVFDGASLAGLVEQARPLGTQEIGQGQWVNMFWPDEHASHADAIKIPATIVAFSTAMGGILLATIFYCWRSLDPEDAKSAFLPIHRFLVNKWWFDELYDFVFVRPSKWFGGLIAAFDRTWIDGLLHGIANTTKRVSKFWEAFIDQGLIDGSVNKAASWTHSLGLGLRGVQTGKLRQYVLFIVAGTIAVFVAATFFWGYAFAS